MNISPYHYHQFFSDPHPCLSLGQAFYSSLFLFLYFFKTLWFAVLLMEGYHAFYIITFQHPFISGVISFNYHCHNGSFSALTALFHHLWQLPIMDWPSWPSTLFSLDSLPYYLWVKLLQKQLETHLTARSVFLLEFKHRCVTSTPVLFTTIP